MRPTSLFALTLCWLLPGCANGPSPRLEQYPELEHALRDFQQQQAQFRQTNAMVAPLVFADAGTVEVREVALEGYPGNTWVRCRFLYQNTTGKPLRRAWVSLDVLDGHGEIVASQSTMCIVPRLQPMADGAYYYDELRTRTLDAHLQPGWSWRIWCVAEPEMAEAYPPRAERDRQRVIVPSAPVPHRIEARQPWVEPTGQGSGAAGASAAGASAGNGGRSGG